MGNTPGVPADSSPLSFEASVQSVMQAMNSAGVEMVQGDINSVAAVFQQRKVELLSSNAGPLVAGDLTVDDIALNTVQGTSSGCTLHSGPAVASDVSITLIDEFGESYEFKCTNEDGRCMRFWSCENDYCAIQCAGAGGLQFHAIPIDGVECRVGGLVMIPSQTNTQCAEENRLCGVCR